MEEDKTELGLEFDDKLKYVDKNRIRYANSEVKNSLLRVLMCFMIFESEFFESPVYEPENDNVKWDSVSHRLQRVQDFFNDGNYNLIDQSWFVKFQNYFYQLYFTSDDGKNRFNAMGFNEKSNLEGFKEYTLKDIEHFLDCAQVNTRSFHRYFKQNEKYAIKNALKLCYVFRNNICHGKKGLDDLVDGTYKTDFDAISDFLIGLMTFLKSNYAEKKF